MAVPIPYEHKKGTQDISIRKHKQYKKKVNTPERMINTAKKHITITAKSSNTDHSLTSRIGLAYKRAFVYAQ